MDNPFEYTSVTFSGMDEIGNATMTINDNFIRGYILYKLSKNSNLYNGKLIYSK